MVKKSSTHSFSSVQDIGIIGAGQMGLEIAALNARNGFPVTIYDSNPAMLQSVKSRLNEELANVPETLRQEMLDLVETGTLEELGECDLIIEAIVEKIEAKSALFDDFHHQHVHDSDRKTGGSFSPSEKLRRFPLSASGLESRAGGDDPLVSNLGGGPSASE